MTRVRALALLLAVAAGWGLTAPQLTRWAGLMVNAGADKEFADHVVPGVIVLAVVAMTLARGRHSLALALLAMLAGLWMTATHVLLLVQVTTGQVGLVAALVHTLPGVLILFLAGVGAFTATRDGPRLA